MYAQAAPSTPTSATATAIRRCLGETVSDGIGWIEVAVAFVTGMLSPTPLATGPFLLLD